MEMFASRGRLQYTVVASHMHHPFVPVFRSSTFGLHSFTSHTLKSRRLNHGQHADLYSKDITTNIYLLSLGRILASGAPLVLK